MRRVLLGVGMLLFLGLLVSAWMWFRSRRQQARERLTNLVGPLAPLTATVPPLLDPASSALESEALASALATGSDTPGRARQLIQKLLYSLLWQRQHFAQVQRQAAQEIAEMEQRLEQTHAPLQQRIRAYEQRILELEQVLARKGRENSELIKAKILMTKQQMELIRARATADWKN